MIIPELPDTLDIEKLFGVSGRVFPVQEMGLEPTQPCDYRHLKPARLPFRHSCEQIVFYRTSGKMSTLFLTFAKTFFEKNYLTF